MKTILAVDDSTSMRKMVSFTLTTSGYNVIEACDGLDGLTKARENNIDLVLSDVNMPNMNGIELTKSLRSEESYKYTPILLLTTEACEDKKSEGKSAGVTGWITKPFNPPKLLKIVDKLLG